MKTKLLFIFTLFLSSFMINAQNIGFLGDFNGWASDVDMTTTDNITFTISNYYLPATGLKFRQDDAWDNSWGGDTFPTGTWADNNIAVTAGFYDISLNIATTEYVFTPVTPSNQNVSIIGDFNAWGGDLALTTTDNITYTATEVALSTGGLKFRRDANWSVNYGGTALEGTATPSSTDNIPIPSTTDYDISFNIDTLEYSIVESALGIEQFELSNSYKIINGNLHANKSENISVFVYSLNGQLIHTFKNHQMHASSILNLELSKNTLYFVKIESENGSQTIKTIF